MTAPAAPTLSGYDRPQPPFPSQVVEEAVRALLRAARAHQLYLTNNPVHAKAIEQVGRAFAALWQHAESVTLVVSETTLVWEGVVVLEDKEKGNDSLPWTCYKDGVRSLQISQGFEGDEVVRFLDVLQRVRRASPDEDDLLTLLWQGDFVTLRYTYVDLSLDGAPAELDAPAEPPRVELAAVQAHVESPVHPGLVSIDDFSGTLYFLDEKEIEALRAAVDAEYAADLRRNVLAVLFDTLESQPAPAVREEVCALLDAQLLHLLSVGQFGTVAYLLREARALAAGQGAAGAPLQPEVTARLANLPSALSDPASLTQLLESLDESGELPAADDLAELFKELRPASLGTVLGWLPRTNKPQLRALLEAAADRLAAANVNELVRVLGGADRGAVVEAAKRAAALKTPAAVGQLTRLLADAEPAMRLVAATALGEIGSPGALQAVERAVEDASRDVRMAAARAVGARAYRPALARVEAVVKGKGIRDADLTEKVAMFEAYGALCGDAGVPLLDGLLNGKSLLGRREEPELRACAALALGRVQTAAARASLDRAAGEKDVVVRNAVNRAVRGGHG